MKEEEEEHRMMMMMVRIRENKMTRDHMPENCAAPAQRHDTERNDKKVSEKRKKVPLNLAD